jgi:hypothetical protein
MIASNSQQKIISCVFGDALNFVRKSFHQWRQDVSVENGERLIEFPELFWINISQTDVTVVIDVFDSELGFQSIEESDFSELIGSMLNALFWLSFRNSGTEIGQSVYCSFFREGHTK